MDLAKGSKQRQSCQKMESALQRIRTMAQDDPPIDTPRNSQVSQLALPLADLTIL